MTDHAQLTSLPDGAVPDIPTASGFDGAGAHIGVFDSGLGGLSVLRALHGRLPLADLSYVADSGHAPYGEREGNFIVSRSQLICDFLVGRSVDAIVVACNTATAAAIHLLREAHPTVPIIGVEPGVKPAVQRSRAKRIGVLATPATLASDKYKRLIDTHAKDALILPQPCPGLAREIEKGEIDTPALRDLIARFAAPLKEAAVDTVVLGCTHYPFVTPLLQAELGEEVEVIDTAEAIAEQAARLCARQTGTGSPSEVPLPLTTGKMMFWTSGDPHHLAQIARSWLGLDAHVAALEHSR